MVGWQRALISVGFSLLFLGACSSEPVVPVQTGPFTATANTSQPIERPDVEQVRGSIARIIGFGCGAPALGSGFAVEPDLVVTSGHIVTGRDPETLAVLLLDGREIGATLVGLDGDLDLAALLLDEPVLTPVNLVTTVPIVDGVAVGVRSEDGEPVVNELEFVVDAPVIVNWDGIFRDTESRYRGIRIEAEIRLGDSGSGLFVNDRDVIGVMQSKNRNGIPRGFAVGANEVVSFLSSIDPDVEVVAERCS